MDLLKDLAKASGNELAGVVSDGIVAGDVDGYIDTGSYILNALVSGDIYRGIPSNKITALAGESATGKTFFALGMVQKFLNDNPEGNVVYFESESALTPEMIEEREIDKNRFSLVFDIKKVDSENNTSVINFVLSNTSDNSIDSKNWSLFWSQMYGDIDNNSLPEGVTYESINGDYRRLNFEGNNEIVAGALKVIPDEMRLYVNKNEVELTNTEFNLLLYFVSNKNRVCLLYTSDAADE